MGNIVPLMFAKPTVQNRVLFYLRHHPTWISGLELESQAQYWNSKPSIISRRARELANNGRIDRQLDTRRNVQYRFKGI